MRYELTDFQAKAVEELHKKLLTAQNNYRNDNDELGALVLSAATGAGKTVIATAFIEQLLFGGDLGDPINGTTILWVTNDPSLNQQTARKMQDASEKISNIRIIGQGSGFDEERFEPGVVYFLNTQAASKSSRLNQSDDRQNHSIWETIRNTIEKRGAQFIVIVDEAHHGVSEKKSTGDMTIVNRILSGALPVPVFIGISATTEKLDKALQNQISHSKRVVRRVDVAIEDVRASGLVKDRIILGATGEESMTVADTTFVRLGVQKTIEFEGAWAAYTQAQQEKTVNPALVIQLPNTPSDQELTNVVEAVLQEWPGLKARNIVHVFGEHQLIDLGSNRAIRYMPPQDIQDAYDVRVILAKNAVTTGWDCPRAEVLVSLRSSEEYTPIAQLIGRIVRQPLARRIISDESLNKVHAYLPRFNAETLGRVVGQFQQGDSAMLAEPVRITVDYEVSGAMSEVLQVLRGVPTYTVPSQASAPATRRAHALAALLAADGLFPGAPTEARRVLNERLDWLRAKLPDLDQRRENVASGSVYEIQISPDGTVIDGEATTVGVQLDAKNVNDVFSSAARELKDGTAEDFWNFLVDSEPDTDIIDHKITVAALGLHAETVEKVFEEADELVRDWLKKFGKGISDLPEARRAAYERLRAQSRQPERKTVLDLSDRIEDAVSALDDPNLTDEKLRQRIANDKTHRWPLHVYSDPIDDLYWKAPTKSDGLERKVLKTELADPATVAWYRNPPGGDKALCVPYKDSATGKHVRLHPDFVFIHDVEGKLFPSILDPHGINLADWEDKLRGMMAYAEKHASAFRSINPITEIDGKVLALAVHDAGTRSKITAALDEGDSVEKVFRDLGLAYGTL